MPKTRFFSIAANVSFFPRVKGQLVGVLFSSAVDGPSSVYVGAFAEQTLSPEQLVSGTAPTVGMVARAVFGDLGSYIAYVPVNVPCNLDTMITVQPTGWVGLYFDEA